MPKSFITLTMFVIMLTASSHVSAFALIDLDPKTSAPNLLAAEESQGEEVATVELVRKQTGHLLALVPVNFKVRVVAHADGRLEIDYPWYSFMTLSHRQELETKLRVAAETAKGNASVGSIKAAGESADPKFTQAEAQAVAEELSLVLAEYDDENGD